MNLTQPNPPSKAYTACPFCGIEDLHYWHHVFGASDKKASERYGAVIYPCELCHTWNTDSIHKDAEQTKNKMLHKRFQSLVMDVYHMDFDEWRTHFRKSYL